MNDDEEQLREQLRIQADEAEKQETAEREAQRKQTARGTDPLGEEHLRKQIPGYQPETPEKKEKRQAENRAELGTPKDKPLSWGKSTRDHYLRAQVGRKIVVYTRNRQAPKTEGILLDIDWEFGGLVIETEGHSPSTIALIGMKDIVKFLLPKQ